MGTGPQERRMKRTIDIPSRAYRAHRLQGLGLSAGWQETEGMEKKKKTFFSVDIYTYIYRLVEF